MKRPRDVLSPLDDLVSLRVLKHSTPIEHDESVASTGTVAVMPLGHLTCHAHTPGGHHHREEDAEDGKLHGLWAVRAGPRQKVYFSPASVRAAIVTVGGLCPGLNDVVRDVTLVLESYGVSQIFGIRYGLHGFYDASPIALNRDVVDCIHESGGTFLGTTRGGSDVPKMCGVENGTRRSLSDRGHPSKMRCH